MQTVRAKFRCNTVEQSTSEPTQVMRHLPDGGDSSIPEDQRYAKYTPSGELRINVDNPAVVFEPGRQYYLDFTLAEEEPPR